MIVVCARESPRSVIISARSRKLSLYRRYQRTQSTMISWSKCRPLKSPSIFVCARQLCRSTDLPTTMLCPSCSHQSQRLRAEADEGARGLEREELWRRYKAGEMILGIANALGQRTTNLYRVLQASGAAFTCRPSPLSNGGRPPPPVARRRSRGRDGGRAGDQPGLVRAEEENAFGSTAAVSFPAQRASGRSDLVGAEYPERAAA